ncbi:MAG: hypothetical protein ACFE9Z_17790, partial [Promethearchaeota archaeon]
TDLENYHLHPDFNDETSFTIEFSALEWEVFDSQYIKKGSDNFIFRPREFYNVSILYTGAISNDIFSVQYIVPKGQYGDDETLLPFVYAFAQKSNDDTIKQFLIPNTELINCIEQNNPNSYNYTIYFNTIETYIKNTYGQDYELLEDSYIYVTAMYYSDLLNYPLSHTPYNYEYLGEENALYHIALYINDEFICYSNETEFQNYIEKIEDGKVYFNNRSYGEDGYIAVLSDIKLEYKFKLQPGLLDRIHFMIVTYPWTNQYNMIMDSSTMDSIPVYRESYRKLSGGSIITPFEYSLSIDNKYSLYLTYRLNQREYYEEKFEIKPEYYNSDKGGYVYEFMSEELDNYIDILQINGEDSITVYYFDEFDNIKFLSKYHYSVPPFSNEIVIKNDGNPLASHNDITQFYVSFIPESNDKSFDSYRFSYDPSLEITETLEMTYWDVLGVNGIDVIPNLDAYYFLNEDESSLNSFVCYASQIAIYISEGNQLEFNISDELTNFDINIINDIHNGKFLAFYVDTNIKNLESLEYITIELYDNSGKMEGFDQIISKDEIEMYDFNIRINLPTDTNTLKKLRFIPTFRNDDEYSSNNIKGISRYQVLEWDSEQISTIDGQDYLRIELENDLKTDNPELAYVYNDKLQYLTFPEGFSISYTLENYSSMLSSYILYVPSFYINPDTNETTRFREGQSLVIRYNSPVRKGIVMGIGNIYFESKSYNYDSHSDLPKAEFMLVNADSSTAYSEFTDDYYYQSALQLTPFDTEYNNKYKSIKIDLNLTSLYESTGFNILNFTHLIFSVPNPSYEFTLHEILILEESIDVSEEYGSIDSRVWQYTEVEMFTASSDPNNDEYQLSFSKLPPFYPDSKWLDYLIITDENGNYYSAGLNGNDHQLHYNPSNNTFTWNPEFNQFPEYFGMEFQEPLIVEPNITLFFEYACNTS